MSERLCAVDGCGPARIHGRGMCQKHYLRAVKYGDPDANPRFYATGPCAIDGCDAPAKRSRYCTTHRARMERYGSPELPPRAGRHSNQRGYQLIRRPGHPVARKDGWAYEHRVVLFDAIGPGIHDCNWCHKPVSWDRVHREHIDALVVDHLDEVVTNNDASNLVPSCGVCNAARSHPSKKRTRERV